MKDFALTYENIKIKKTPEIKYGRHANCHNT